MVTNEFCREASSGTVSLRPMPIPTPMGEINAKVLTYTAINQVLTPRKQTRKESSKDKYALFIRTHEFLTAKCTRKRKMSPLEFETSWTIKMWVFYLNWWTAFRSKKRWHTCDKRWRKRETRRIWCPWSGPKQCLRRPHEGSRPVWPKSPLKQPTKALSLWSFIPEVFPVVQKIICWGTWDFYYTYQIIVNSLGIGFL